MLVTDSIYDLALQPKVLFNSRVDIFLFLRVYQDVGRGSSRGKEIPWDLEAHMEVFRSPGGGFSVP